MNNTTNKTLEATLTSLGLNDKEILVYTTMLNIGKAPASEIISKSGLKKGNTYDLLYNLESLGLVTKIQKDGKMNFQVEPPTKLLGLAETKKDSVEAATQSLKALLPMLNAEYQSSVGKPSISYFEGEEGIKEVFEDIYSPKDDIVYGCVDLEESDKSFPSYIMKRLIPKRIKNKVIAHSIIADSEQSREIQKDDENQLRRSILIPKDQYPMPAEIDVYEDKIAMLTFEKGKFIGLVIQNQALATTLKSIFKLAFDSKDTPKKS